MIWPKAGLTASSVIDEESKQSDISPSSTDGYKLIKWGLGCHVLAFTNCQCCMTDEKGYCEILTQGARLSLLLHDLIGSDQFERMIETRNFTFARRFEDRSQS